MHFMEPIYWAVSWVMLAWHSVFHAMGAGQWLGTNWDWILSIVFLVLTVRAILFPLFVRQIRSQRAMQALQPQLKALQEKHKGDRETLQREMMELYKREKANPLMGCLPLLIQSPIFLGVYHIIKRLGTGTKPDGKTLYGWTVAQFESGQSAKLFGVSVGATMKSHPGAGWWAVALCAILGAVMIGTTYMTSRQMILKTGWSEDPQQRMMQKVMLYVLPGTFVFSVAIFPLGVIVYWTTSNLFSMSQQFWVLKKYPPLVNGKPVATPVKAKKGEAVPEIEAKVVAPKVGAKPINPKKGGQKPKVG